MRIGMVGAMVLTVLLAGCGKTPAEADPAARKTLAAASPSEPAAPATAPGGTPATESSAPPQTTLSDPAKLPDRLQALGTEPFWSVRIAGTKLRYSTPEDQAGHEFTATREDTAIATTFSGTLAGKRFELSIVAEKCSDGMSDTEYPFSAWLSYSGQRHHGCARKAS